MEHWLIASLSLLIFGASILIGQYLYNVEKRLRQLEEKTREKS